MTLLIGKWLRPAHAATLAAIGALLLAGPARADFLDNIYTAGHADGLAVGLEDEDGPGGNAPRLFLHYHFEGATINGSTVTDLELAPGDVTTVVPESVKQPAPIALPFLGLNAGNDVWVLPQINVPGLPFLGLASEGIFEPSEWSTPITFSLTGFSGPGNFALWQSTALGGLTVLFDTVDGIGPDDAFNFPIGAHDHANWGFTATGLYDLTIRAQGTHNTFGTLSDSATYRFRVEPFQPAAIPEPASLAMMALGACGVLGAVAARRSASRLGAAVEKA